MARYVAQGILLAFIGQFAILAAADPAAAAPPDDVARVEALEKEVAVLRQEIAALRKQTKVQAAPARVKAGHEAPSARRSGGEALGASPLAAYAAAVPVLKAPPPPIRGELRAWIEGGGFWTGGQPVYSFFDILTVSSLLVPVGAVVPSFFELKPEFGWTAAAGFDYRFAGSPWHVSAQFRYGQARSSDGTTFSVTGGPILRSCRPL